MGERLKRITKLPAKLENNGYVEVTTDTYNQQSKKRKFEDDDDDAEDKDFSPSEAIASKKNKKELEKDKDEDIEGRGEEIVSNVDGENTKKNLIKPKKNKKITEKPIENLTSQLKLKQIDRLLFYLILLLFIYL